MINKIYLITALCIIFSHAFGQKPNPEDIKKLKLVVVIYEPSKKDNELSRIRSNYNERIKQAVEESWKLGNEVTYIIEKEFEKIKWKYQIKNAIVLERAKWERNNTIVKFYSILYCIYGENGRPDYNRGADYLTTTDDPNVEQLRFTLLLAQNGILNAGFIQRSNENLNKLKTDTLLIDKDKLSPEVNEAIIQSSYKYPYKIVSSKEIKEAFMKEAKNTAFMAITPSFYLGRKSCFAVIYLCDGSDKIVTYELSKCDFTVETCFNSITPDLLKHFNQEIEAAK